MHRLLYSLFCVVRSVVKSLIEGVNDKEKDEMRHFISPQCFFNVSLYHPYWCRNQFKDFSSSYPAKKSLKPKPFIRDVFKKFQG